MSNIVYSNISRKSEITDYKIRYIMIVISKSYIDNMIEAIK